MRIWIILVIFGIFFLGAQFSFAQTFPGTNGKIVFETNRDGGNAEIYTMNSDGTFPTRLTDNVLSSSQSHWSSDGTKIVFTRFDATFANEIFVMNADGSDQTNISNNAASDAHPSFSPDGTKIVFTRFDATFANEIFVMNADGSGASKLHPDHTGNDFEPVWSPDGTKIAFVSFQFGPAEIVIINADGTDETRLTFTGSVVGPAWSPDGTQLVYHNSASDNIFKINADGTGEMQLTSTADGDLQPTFSPDGTQIAFVRFLSGGTGGEIFVMNADGNNPTRITTDDTFDQDPDWQPIPPFPPEPCDLPTPELDYVISSSCTLSSTVSVDKNVIVQSGAVMIVTGTLDIDFASFNLTVKSGSGVLIKAGGKIT